MQQKDTKDISKNIVCVPTSFQARQLIKDHSLQLGSLDHYPVLEYAIDGADEVDCNLNLIKGGGGCLTQEKIVAFASNKLWIICDASKKSGFLCEGWKKGVPIEVIPSSYAVVQSKLKTLFPQVKESNLRLAVNKAGPVVTDNGNFILDTVFKEENLQRMNWETIDKNIGNLPGVVSTGLFINMAEKVFIGEVDGTVTVNSKSSSKDVLDVYSITGLDS